MNLLGTPEIIRRCSVATGLDADKCREVFDRVVMVIAREMDKSKGDDVVIDGFGRFQSPVIGPFAKGASRPAFEPATELEERLNDAPLSTPSAAAPPPRLHGKAPRPLRPEDEEIIEKWLAYRQSEDGTNVTMATLYPASTGKVLRYSNEKTIGMARRSLRAFARRCDVPLLKVGLGTDAGELALYKHGALRREIWLYFEDYKMRVTPRLAETTPGGRLPSAARTMGWNKFVLYATDFYQWLIDQGYREKGTHPLDGIARHAPFDLAKERLAIVRAWYKEILEHPSVSPRDRAIMLLFSQGLRTNEIITMKLEQVRLSEGAVYVDGKGGKRRRVILFSWVIFGIDRYLESRRFSTDPYLFPSRRSADGHMSYAKAWRIVRAAAARAFPRDDQARIRLRIHPHGFRHYYITEMTRRGAHPKAIMSQTGHSDVRTMIRYVSMDPELIEEQVRDASQTPWFKAASS